ncbi:plasmid segregation protein ParM domain-containing protein, partial [Providencia huaxiensis]|uniref:plasmid segregation protein ParM domain-containing protein n=1 Tax=Providencia huaxiensis TaxID=2027290 RepID=UPI0034E37BB2
WFDNEALQTKLSTNSFKKGWKIEGLGGKGTFNYELDGQKFTYDEVSEQAIRTTHIEYQYADANVLAIHHALLSSGLEPQDIKLVVTLPISEFYTADCQKNELNIQRKIENVLRPVKLNKGITFTIKGVEVMPESLPAVLTQLVDDNVGEFEKSLVIDLGGTTLDVGVIVGQFDGV